MIIEPSRDAYLRYLSSAEPVSGRFSSEAMGAEEWARMLTDGAVAACEVFASGGSLREAIGAALSHTPVADVPVSVHRSEERSLATTLVVLGPPTFCPSVAPDLPGNEEEVMAEFQRAWLDHIGAAPSAGDRGWA